MKYVEGVGFKYEREDVLRHAKYDESGFWSRVLEAFDQIPRLIKMTRKELTDELRRRGMVIGWHTWNKRGQIYRLIAHDYGEDVAHQLQVNITHYEGP